MKLFTLIEHQNQLEKAEVEIELIPGIPQIHFLGLPDKLIKESFFRIKSAFKSCGYKFPQSQQVIVNIKPNHLKKTSKGLELAVALGLLIKTQQKQIPDFILKSIIYGELELNGQVQAPSDIHQFLAKFPNQTVLTGMSEVNSQALYRIEKINSDIFEFQLEEDHSWWERPREGLDSHFNEDEAELLFLMATTGLHTLLAGASGFGKSTLSKKYLSFLKSPTDQDRPFLLNRWRPCISPHQSVTPAAFLGGGAQLYQGEVEKAQSGLLLLDELLEFNPVILEALRGPMTGEKLRLSRQGVTREYACHFQVIATTNLCPCGKWVPKDSMNCRYTRTKCESYLNRLSGPLADRFGLLYFYSQKNKKRHISGSSILLRIEDYFKSDVQLNLNDVESLQNLYPDSSYRRLKALKSVAAVYASERKSQIIELSDLNRAEKWTIRSFIDLEKGMS